MVLLRERKSRLGGFIEPCLPSPAKVPPSGPNWLHEIKHDGFRIMARRDAAGVRLITRNGNDFTRRFPPAAAAVAALPGRCCLIDGEAKVAAIALANKMARMAWAIMAKGERYEITPGIRRDVTVGSAHLNSVCSSKSGNS